MDDTDAQVAAARLAIDGLVREFYALFDNRGGRTPALERIHALCLPQALIVKAVDPEPEASTPAQFIAPRQRLLADGSLVEFHEAELESRTEVRGQVAQRLSRYAKSGIRAGARFQAQGTKIFQFAHTPRGWRISAVAWDDDRDAGA